MLKYIWSGFFLVASFNVKAQAPDNPKFSFEATLNNYIFKDDYIFNPVLTADKGTLHLESRYNYEDLNTLSLFAGYNIEAGNELYFELTPMFGFAFGETNGVIPALEFTVTFGKLEWYSESEYLFITDEGGENYFYGWSEFNFYPQEWFSLGAIGTRTRLYDTDSDVLGGVSVGYYHRDLSLMAALMNLGGDGPFLYISASYGF